MIVGSAGAAGVIIRSLRGYNQLSEPQAQVTVIKNSDRGAAV